MTEQVAQFVAGAVALAVGGVVLARGAGRAARRVGVNPAAAALALAAFGCAAPVLAVSLTAALKGYPGVSLGCVIGATIANIGLVLGLAAVVHPMQARSRLLWAEIPLLIAANLLVWFLSRDNAFSRTDGVVLLAAFAAWAVYSARLLRAYPLADEVNPPPTAGPVWVVRLLVVVGIAVLAGGAQLLVPAAVRLDQPLGLSQWTTGLTLVTAAVVLPGLVATVTAARRGHADLAVGTVVGANLVNLLLVLGVTLVVNPVAVRDRALFREVPAMALFTLLLVPILVNGLRITRWEGLVLLAAYAALVTWQAGVFK